MRHSEAGDGVYVHCPKLPCELPRTKLFLIQDGNCLGRSLLCIVSAWHELFFINIHDLEIRKDCSQKDDFAPS